ncbi:2-amino-4-hydroxy-6-hydroxymethyldihydropteridine diphosphokinase [Candidatus Sumerlaeota bacterium]|nr:2-amino-4-hydroxy-6-hydroxymethyldihydropteridine diphosphokinase [Candidatus Sumerlaeota bacterium]
MPERAHIALGSNMGHREAMIAEATMRIDNLPETDVTKISSLYETRPVGKVDQPLFLNAVAEAWTDLSPERLLGELLAIETVMGRARTEPNGPRLIDLDLLLVGDQTCQTEALILPHPRMAERHFVLVPLTEISPDLQHPQTGQPWTEILEALPATDWGQVVDPDE